MGNFGTVIAKIDFLKRELREFLREEAEEWYQDNIFLGGVQVKKGVVGRTHERKHSYPHPPLQETNQLVYSIGAKTSRNKITVSHKTRNYRPGKTNADYGKIQNDRYEFMKADGHFEKYINGRFVRKLKNIFN